MKTYKVKLLTQKGQIERTITDSEDINALNEAIRAEYGDFTTISSEEIGIDLFEDYEDQPEDLKAIIDAHETELMDGDYKELENLLAKCEAIGYTFEYYLDGVAYDLRKIGQKGKAEFELQNS